MMEDDEQIRLKLRGDILNALSKVYSRDRELLGDEIDVCERSLMHRFTHYFMTYVEDSGDEFYKDLNVDGEYNRHIKDEKKIVNKGGDEVLAFPDVIVHKRVGEKNLCVVEFKKYQGQTRRFEDIVEHDRDKLEYMTSQTGRYKYKWGVHIVFHPQAAQCDGTRLIGVKMQWFRNGGPHGEDEAVKLPMTASQFAAHE